MASISKLIHNPYRIVYLLDRLHLSRLIPDRTYLQMKYKAAFAKKMNLDKPTTFNEKLNWLKLYDRNPKYINLVDKYEVKKIVAELIGEEYIIPTLGVWDRFEEIDFDILPAQFVLKCTHDSGGLVICKDKSKLDIDKAREKLTKSLRTNFFWQGREWPYKNVKPRIIAEQYMEDEKTAELRDYKFFCFDGTARALFIATERQKEGEEVKFDFFDMNFEHLDFCQGHPNSTHPIQKPITFEQMKRLAEKLSIGFPQLRVDFYEVNGKVYFGELTFFHHNGLVPFEPKEWDYKFGSWIKLPIQKI